MQSKRNLGGASKAFGVDIAVSAQGMVAVGFIQRPPRAAHQQQTRAPDARAHRRLTHLFHRNQSLK